MRNLLTVFFLLMLATLSLGGCIRAPLPPVSNFYQDGYGNTLLSEEKVLQYRENYGDVIALTDERILYNTGPRDGCWRPSYPNESVDLANIRKIAWQRKYRNIDFIHLDLYGELGTVDIDYPWDDERITQAIQAQVDYINTIRNELGISIPESVTTSELNKINKPVIAELRARRKKAAYTTSHRLEEDASTQNECPDITGIYYGRSVYSFKSYPSDDGYVNSMDEPLCPENNNDWMSSHCSLTE